MTEMIKIKIIPTKNDTKTKVRLWGCDGKYMQFFYTHPELKKPSQSEIIKDLQNRLQTYEARKQYYSSIKRTIKHQEKLYKSAKYALRNQYQKFIKEGDIECQNGKV